MRVVAELPRCMVERMDRTTDCCMHALHPNYTTSLTREIASGRHPDDVQPKPEVNTSLEAFYIESNV